MNTFCDSNGHHREIFQSSSVYARALKTMLQWSCMHNAWTFFWTPCRVVIFLSSLSLRLFHAHAFLPPRLLYLLILVSLLQPHPLCLHLIHYFYCALLDHHWIAAFAGAVKREGTVQFWGETSCSQEMPCQDKTRLLCMPCETICLCSRVSLFLYTISAGEDTQWECL